MDQNPQLDAVAQNQIVNQTLANAPVAPSNQAQSDVSPFYRQWYFWTNMALLVIAIIGWVTMLIMLADNQRMQSQISELETEMEARTQLLVKYGAELGLKTDQYFRPQGTDNTSATKNTTKK